MPDLGSYAHWVLGAYGAALVLLAGLVVLSGVEARRMRARLAALEAERSSRAAPDLAQSKAPSPAGPAVDGQGAERTETPQHG